MQKFRALTTESGGWKKDQLPKREVQVRLRCGSCQLWLWKTVVVYRKRVQERKQLNILSRTGAAASRTPGTNSRSLSLSMDLFSLFHLSRSSCFSLELFLSLSSSSCIPFKPFQSPSFRTTTSNSLLHLGTYGCTAKETPGSEVPVAVCVVPWICAATSHKFRIR
jgi:hypothetical protein